MFGTEAAEKLYEGITLRRRGGCETEKPRVAINMVASADGKATKEGKASRIGGETDREVMRALRAKVDAVVVGAGTVRAERLSLGVDNLPEDSYAQPVAAILSASGDVALQNLVVTSGQRLLVFVADDTPERKLEPLRERGAAVITTSIDDSGAGLNLREIVHKLAFDHGAEALLVEGGPKLNRAMISAGLVDELFLTVAPKLLGGPSAAGAAADLHPAPQTIVEGKPFDPPINLKLLSAQQIGDELFLRYAL